MKRARRVLAVTAAVAVSFSGLTAAPAMGATQPTDLLLSEHVAGSGDNSAVEIYNGTGSSVDMGASGFQLLVLFGGGPNGIIIPLSGVLADGGTYVVGSLASPTSPLAAYLDKQVGAAYWDGDDVIVLQSSAGVADSFGQVGVDPGTEWPGGGADETLRRHTTVCTGDTVTDDAFDASVQWTSHPIDTFDGLGTHSLDCDGNTGGSDDGGDTEDPFQRLRDLLDELSEAGLVAPQMHRTFHARVDRIEQLRAAGKDDAAAAQLAAFHDQLDGVTPRHVTVEAATQLHEYAHHLG